jgi:TrmH family RNA methyltransferase
LSGVFPFLKGGKQGLEYITSRQNKRIQGLKKLIEKTSERKDKNLSVASGVKLFSELSNSKTEIKEIYLTEKCNSLLGETLVPYKDKITVISEDIANYVSDQKTPEGIFCVFTRPVLKTIPNGKRFILLDGLQDIGNIGTIIRTADAFSIDGVILSHDSADIFSPKGLRASMGSVLRVNISQMAMEDAISSLKEKGVVTFASVLSENEEDSFDNIEFSSPSAVIIGNEGNGISKEVINLADKKLTIPMSGGAESLNAAVAAGIIMYKLGKGYGRD